MTSGEKMSKGMSLFVDGLGELVKDMAETIKKTLDNVWPKINPILERKFTKKKFKKMLQSYGIQRNEINKIMETVKAPYTMKKLMNYITPNDIRRRNR